MNPLEQQSELQAEFKLQPENLQPCLLISEKDAKFEQNLGFFDLQSQAKKAIQQFLQNPHQSLLMLKTEIQAEIIDGLQNYILTQKNSLPITGVNYHIEQADSFSFAQVSCSPALSNSDNFANKKIVDSALYFDQNKLFGSVKIHPISKDIQLESGLVHQLNQGVLILSLPTLLEQFSLWGRLKAILQTKQFDWFTANSSKNLPCEIPSYPMDLKLILLGSRDDLATFHDLDPMLYSFADYAEIDSYYPMETVSQQQDWMSYVQSFAHQQGLPALDYSGLNKLYQLLVRESENRTLINISPQNLSHFISDANFYRQQSQLSGGDFQQSFLHKQKQYGFLREQAYQDILQDQVYIETEGDAIGQINGLSVIEYPGTPLSFGEPSRISCIVQFGEGEIVDIERKSELAGNIHGKGMMIAESCLANILSLPSQLPFSASLVFEQSYGEIDGDSASLAAFCVLTSALAELAIPQSIAITGTIDQFGLVHSVGGVNQKIEGFFEICQRRQLTGKQGVIIPTSVLNQLSLNDEIVDAVKQQQFFIWAIDDVAQACEILFNLPLIDEKQPSVAQRIHQRIEQREQSTGSFWTKLFSRK